MGHVRHPPKVHARDEAVDELSRDAGRGSTQATAANGPDQEPNRAVRDSRPGRSSDPDQTGESVQEAEIQIELDHQGKKVAEIFSQKLKQNMTEPI